MKTHKELNITKKQFRNLARLAVRFRDLKPNGYKGSLRMKVFCARDECNRVADIKLEDSREFFHECGSSGCLIGHSYYLGIGKLPKRKYDLTCPRGIQDQWLDFSRETFGFDEESDNWRWLFAAGWDDDKNNAVKRICWIMEKGLASSFDPFDVGYPPEFEFYEPDWEQIETAI